MIAYSTSEPFVLEQLGAAYRTFAPAASGIDFLRRQFVHVRSGGEKPIRNRVAAFRAASVKGWAYALAHKQATVVSDPEKAIRQKRAARPCCLRREHDGDAGRPGSRPDRRTGSCPLAKYRRELTGNSVLLTDDTLPAALIWDRNDGSLRRWLIVLLLVTAGLAVAALVAYPNSPHSARAIARLGALPRFVKMRRLRLSLIRSLLFIGSAFRVLIFILIYNYNKNSAGMVAIRTTRSRTSQAGIERTESLIEGTEEARCVFSRSSGRGS